MLLTIIVIGSITCANCSSAVVGNKNNSDTIKLEFKFLGVDTCFQLPIEANRTIEIVENTVTDTVDLGYVVYFPGQTGKFTYRRYGKGFIDVDLPDDMLPSTNEICIGRYQNREVTGYIKIKYVPFKK